MEALGLYPVSAGKSRGRISTLLGSVAFLGLKHFREKRYCFPRKTSQGPVRHAVRTRSLAYLELSDGMETSVGFVRRPSLAGSRANGSKATLTLST